MATIEVHIKGGVCGLIPWLRSVAYCKVVMVFTLVYIETDGNWTWNEIGVTSLKICKLVMLGRIGELVSMSYLSNVGGQEKTYIKILSVLSVVLVCDYYELSLSHLGGGDNC